MALSVPLSLCLPVAVSVSSSSFFLSLPRACPLLLLPRQTSMKMRFFSVFWGTPPQKPDAVCVFLFPSKSRNPQLPHRAVAAANKDTSEHVADSGLNTVTGYSSKNTFGEFPFSAGILEYSRLTLTHSISTGRMAFVPHLPEPLRPSHQICLWVQRRTRQVKGVVFVAGVFFVFKQSD